MWWLGSRSHLGSHIFLGVGFVDVMLWMYGWMYAVSPRPRLTLWWVVYVWVQYPPVLGLTLWWVMYVCSILLSLFKPSNKVARGVRCDAM